MMKLLIVEGNNEETRVQREAFGIRAYHLLFQEMLHLLVPNAKTEVVFPADNAKELPSIAQLKKYAGVLWTGSSLSILDTSPSVNQQLIFAEDVFKSGVPFYGSCWGMQIAALVAGGQVARNSNGLEFGISKPIQLTKSGEESPFFLHRSTNYSSLCIHFDEVTRLPKNATVLASSSHSKVQAMTFNYKNSQFFGVQYHPEFKTSDMALISSFLSEKLVDCGCFASSVEVQKFSARLLEQNDLPKEIVDYRLHTQEIMAWLNYIVER